MLHVGGSSYLELLPSENRCAAVSCIQSSRIFASEAVLANWSFIARNEVVTYIARVISLLPLVFHIPGLLLV
jgi:hypothetical protein